MRSSTSHKKLLCHQFSKVIVVNAVPYATAAFYKTYTAVSHERMKVADGQGEESSSGFGLSSSCILQHLQVGGGGLYQGAPGSKQTTSLKLQAFAEDLVVFEVSSIESKGERGEASWYRES